MLRLQNAARNSTEWFEDVERYLHLDPVQFNYSLLTRSQRISHENLRAARQGVARERRDVVRGAGDAARSRDTRAPPMFTPFRLRDLTLKNRIVVSPMAQYRAVDGMPTDWHLVHYAERAKGGAGLVYHRDDLRLARGPHHARLHRPLRARARGRVEAHRRFRARRDRREDRHAARPFRAEGLDAARLGGRWMRRCRTGNWPVIGAVAGARGRRATRCRAR